MKNLKSLSWYIFGQAIGYGLDVGFFCALVSVFNLDLLVAANVLGKVCAATFAFFFHAHFSFPGEKNNSRANSAITYVVMLIVNMVLTTFLLSLFVTVFSAYVIAAKFVSDLIGMLVTFCCMRTYVFPRATSS